MYYYRYKHPKGFDYVLTLPKNDYHRRCVHVTRVIEIRPIIGNHIFDSPSFFSTSLSSVKNVVMDDGMAESTMLRGNIPPMSGWIRLTSFVLFGSLRTHKTKCISFVYTYLFKVTRARFVH